MSMCSPRWRGRMVGLAALLLALPVVAGCAVLTKSQVRAVAAFAGATADYGTLPGEPLRIYARVLAADRLLQVSTMDFSAPGAIDRGWVQIGRALAVEAEFAQLGDRADRSLDVLDTYAELLGALSADDYTEALDASATRLAQQLDRGIRTYNDRVRGPAGREPLKLIGGTVAAVVRGGGGLFIRHRQAELLKEYVAAAHPVVEALTREVEDLMVGEGASPGVKPRLATLRDRLGDDFKTAAVRARRLPLFTITSTAETLRAIDSGERIAVAAAAASRRYREAHARLRTELAERRTITGLIEEIEALSIEIKLAQKLRKRLD